MTGKLSFIALIALWSGVASAAPDFSLGYLSAEKLGGDTSVSFKGETVWAFRNPAPNMTEEEIARHLTGDAFFERNFSDVGDRKDYGLGPVFNHTNCAGCHNKDGRGSLPIVTPSNSWTPLRQSEAVFLRISIEDGKPKAKDATTNWGAPTPVPYFSDQLFHLGSYGVREDAPGVGQARVWMKYEFSDFTYADGEVVRLRKPLFKVTDAYNERIYQADVKMGARLGTPMIGLGLLEAIKQEDILAIASMDFSAQGVSGKPNWVLDIQKKMAGEVYPVSLGRFGLKANTPTVFHQSLGALRGDMGVTNYAFPDESIVGTPLFDLFKVKMPFVKVEAPDSVANDLVFYSQTLAVPARRGITEEEVLKGGRLFSEIGCATCHTPSFTTGDHPIKALSQQKIYPFTDLLLHDMGDELADGRQDFDATGREWKTRPLWGLGQTHTVNPRASFLHDGRAKTVEEAILWHGGEGDYSRSKFKNLSKSDRQAVLKFLKSL